MDDTQKAVLSEVLEGLVTNKEEIIELANDLDLEFVQATKVSEL